MKLTAKIMPFVWSIFEPTPASLETGFLWRTGLQYLLKKQFVIESFAKHELKFVSAFHEESEPIVTWFFDKNGLFLWQESSLNLKKIYHHRGTEDTEIFMFPIAADPA